MWSTDKPFDVRSGKLPEPLRDAYGMFLSQPIQALSLLRNVVSVSLKYFQQNLLTFDIG